MGAATTLAALADRLIDQRQTDVWLEGQGLLPLIADRRHQHGMAISMRQRLAARDSAAGQAIATHLAQAVNAAIDGSVIVMKGPETASCHPSPDLRPFTDLDVLVEDADAASAQLRAAGFSHDPGQDPDPTHHHGAPVLCPPLRMPIEVHRRPSWVHWPAEPPAWRHLAAEAQPSRLDVAGLLRPSDAHHAVLVAVHAWRAQPYGRLLDLIDVWLLGQAATPDRAAQVAEQWGVRRLWERTWAASTTIVEGDGRPPAGIGSLGPLRPSAFGRAGRGAIGHLGGLLLTTPASAFPRLLARSCRNVAERTRGAPDQR